MQTNAVDLYPAVVRPRDGGAHAAKRSQRRQAVCTFQKTADPGHAPGQRAEHDGTVGNGLIPRDSDASIQLATVGDVINNLFGHA